MTAITINALLITPEAAHPISLDGAHTASGITAAIGCSTFDVVGLQNGIDVFVDDEGLVNGSPLNLPLTVLAHQLGVASVLFGSGVVVSVDAEGDTVGLSQAQQETVMQALASKPDAATFEALCTSLAPLPGVVALLRASQ